VYDKLPEPAVIPIAVMLPVLAPQLLGDIVGAAVKVGTGLTLTVETAVLVQLLPFLPVTVYDVVTVGVTLIDAPLCDVLQLYVVALLAVKVTGVPAQTVAEFTVTDGVGFTFIVVVFELIQPLAAVPVIV
jgi:hypothetical protein